MYSHRNLPQMVSFESSPSQKLIAGGEKYQTRAVIHLIIQNMLTCANKKELIIQNMCKKSRLRRVSHKRLYVDWVGIGNLWAGLCKEHFRC